MNTITTDEKIDNTEQFSVVLSYVPGSRWRQETHYYSTHARAEAFAKDVWQSIKDFNGFEGVETITLRYAGIPWQTWNALRGNHE